MSLVTLLPVALCLSSALAVVFVPRLLSPVWAARVLVAVISSSALSSLAALLLIVLASLSTIPILDHALGWCADVYGHAAPAWAGIAAATALVIGIVRLGRWHHRWQRAVRPWRDSGPIHIVSDGPPVALAVPGRPGTIVIGSALFSALDAQEQAVVYAHERAHLQLHHDRFVRVGDISAALVPALIPVARRLRFTTERWADEVAAHHTGDRRLVARVVAKAALMSTGQPTLVPAIAATGPTARVEALMADGVPRVSPGAVIMSIVAIAVALGGSSVQMHHLAAFISHVCPGG